MHSTWNADYISHASGQVGMATAPRNEREGNPRREKRHKDEPPNLWTNFSNSCLAPELQMLGRCQRPRGKTAVGRLKKQKQAVQKF